MGECKCGHGQHVHVGYVGGCGLCACVAYRLFALPIRTVTVTCTGATR